MGNELPYMPTFIAEFMAAVQTWPPDRVGAYWLALMFAWEHDGVPADDEKELAAVLHTSRPIARRLWLEIRHKFRRQSDGRWLNPKQEAVRVQARKQHAALSARGKKGADVRWGRGANGHEIDASATATANAQALLGHSLSNGNQNQSQSTPPKPPAGAGGRLTRGDRKKAEDRLKQWFDRERRLRSLESTCPHDLPRCASWSECIEREASEGFLLVRAS